VIMCVNDSAALLFGLPTNVTNCHFSKLQMPRMVGSPSNAGCDRKNRSTSQSFTCNTLLFVTIRYARGRDEYMRSQVPVHITAPYKFAVDQDIATSATAPIANPSVRFLFKFVG